MKTLRTLAFVALSFISSNCLLAQLSTSDFVFTVKTDNPGISSNSSYQLVLRTNDNVGIDWNNDGIFDTTSVSGIITHDYGVVGNYTIRLRGRYPSLVLGTQDASKLISVDQWGDQVWTSCVSMFYECNNLLTTPLDTPN